MGEFSPKTVLDTIKEAKKILLVTHSRPGTDALCATAALTLILREQLKKDIDVAIPAEETGQRAQTILAKAGITPDSLLKKLPQKVYTISIKKEGEKIDSINFNEENGMFNFVITPFNGVLDLNSVKISETGGGYDLIITVDTPSLNFLGELYKENEGAFNNIRSVSFDSHKSNTNYATYPFTTEDVDTTSQVIFHFLEEAEVKISEQVATLLFAGTYAALNLGVRGKVRASTFTDLGTLAEKKANLELADDMLYAPSSMNEIILIGDILDSTNEGTATALQGTKVVGCKINLNKEEVETMDLDKIAQVVFWNIKLPDCRLAYIIFQKATTDSCAYLFAYDANLNLTPHLKSLGGKGEKLSGKVPFAMDMNAAADRLKDAFGITFAQKENKLMGPSFADDFDAMFDDFGDGLGAPAVPPLAPPAQSETAPAVDNAPLPAPFTPQPASSYIPPKEPASPPDANEQSGPTLFDPRLGK